MEAIPAINCYKLECVLERLRLVKRLGAGWVHVDVSDGVFTPARTWSDPVAYKKYAADLGIEVHLMVVRPEDYYESWVSAGAKRIVVHAGAMSRLLMKLIESFPSVEFAAALLAHEKVADLALFTSYLKRALVLAVHPGFSGQVFDPRACTLISALKKAYPALPVEVDGGVNGDIAREVKKAGADVVISASYIFGSPDPRQAFETLRAV